MSAGPCSSLKVVGKEGSVQASPLASGSCWQAWHSLARKHVFSPFISPRGSPCAHIPVSKIRTQVLIRTPFVLDEGALYSGVDLVLCNYIGNNPNSRCNILWSLGLGLHHTNLGRGSQWGLQHRSNPTRVTKGSLWLPCVGPLGVEARVGSGETGQEARPGESPQQR